MNEKITVEHAWEIVKNDVLQKVPAEATSTLSESLGLNKPIDTEVIIDGVLHAMIGTKTLSDEQRTLLQKASSLQKFILFSIHLNRLKSAL